MVTAPIDRMFGGSTSAGAGPDDFIGLEWGEIFGIPQLWYQLLALVFMHAVVHRYFARNKDSAYFRGAKANVMAHYVPFLVCFVFQAVYGTYLWLGDEALGDAAFDRTWGSHGGAKVILVSMLAVQLYDIPVSLAVPDLRILSFILHHVAVLYLVLVELRYGCLHYYAVYFLGVIELSSPFLSLVDAFRDYPALARAYPMTNECARAAFIVAFFAVRVIGWIPVSVDFWSDVLALLPGGGAPTHAMPTAVAYSWLFFHLGLTLLQFHWGRLIASAAYAMLVGDASKRANEAKSA